MMRPLLGGLLLVARAALAQEEQTCSAEWTAVRDKMEAAELSSDFVASFKHSYDAFVSGDRGTIPEGDIEPVDESVIKELESVRGSIRPDPSMLDKLVILKLNGGLGTSMGLERTKSLLHVQGNTTFLDLIAKQVLALRERHQKKLRFTLMNSFSTSADTKELLRRSYPELACVARSPPAPSARAPAALTRAGCWGQGGQRDRGGAEQGAEDRHGDAAPG
eukprot:COSAG04_NODE_564_length_12565_cov_220.319028_5_plen_220_part_00